MPAMAKPSPSFSGAPELVALGSAIRKLRQERGFSQEAFANEIGLDRSYVGGIERGEHNLAIMNLTRLATALGLTPSALLNAAGL